MNRLNMAAAVALACVAVPKAAEAVASAELYRTQAYLYGRFEARIRFAAGDGVISSFFLWKEGSEGSNAFWNELDFEKLGADCHMQTNAIYGRPSVQHAQTNQMPGDICSEYHDYRFEWTPTYIAWAVDGKEIRRETGETASAFSQNATGGMTFHFNVWPGNEDFGGNFSASILPVREHISWVSYSSYDNGSFKLEWKEDFNGTNLPSGWSTGNWASPYSLSTHKPANVTINSGILTLSLTADNATGFSGTPPADDGATGGSGAGGSTSGGTSTTAGGARGGTTATGGTGSAPRSSASSSGTGRGGASGSSAAGGAANTAGGTESGGEASSGGDGGSEDTGAGDGSSRGGNTQSGSSARGGATSSATRSTKSSDAGGDASTQPHSSSPAVTSTSTATGKDDGCGCRLVSSSANPSRSAFGLFGLAFLLGAAVRRRAGRALARS